MIGGTPLPLDPRRWPATGASVSTTRLPASCVRLTQTMATTKSADLPLLRSVVLAGLSGAGKTTLAEALLFRTGAITRLGRVEDGTTILDTEPEAQKRHISLSLGVASLDDEGNVVTLVDTPGYPDFVAAVSYTPLTLPTN